MRCHTPRTKKAGQNWNQWGAGQATRYQHAVQIWTQEEANKHPIFHLHIQPLSVFFSLRRKGCVNGTATVQVVENLSMEDDGGDISGDGGRQRAMEVTQLESESMRERWKERKKWWEGAVCQQRRCGWGPAGPSGGPVIGLGFYTWAAHLHRDGWGKKNEINCVLYAVGEWKLGIG